MTRPTHLSDHEDELGAKEKPEPKRAKSHRLYTVVEVLGCRTTDFLMNWKVVSWVTLASISTRIGSGPHKDERLPGAAGRPELILVCLGYQTVLGAARLI